MRQIEMTWTCSSCGSRNLGRQLVCSSCGNPKDASERYEMPSTTTAAPTVTDPDMLRIAKGGPNWRCRHCGSDQRRPDGSCVQCGAGQSSARARVPAPRKMSASEPDENVPWFRHPLTMVIAGVVALFSAFAWLNRTRTFEATVMGVSWEQTISVERYQLWDKEGWAAEVPSSAVDVRDLGDRIHHYDKVLDGYETESYTARVRCGEDCVTAPRRCTEHCASNENGFATCQDVCTGGGRSCSPRYCDEPRTRQVPVYHEEPRYAKFAAYRVWAWGPHRTVKAAGASTTDLRWPEQEARVGLDVAPGEQEREVREGRYVVSLEYDEGDSISVVVAAEQFPKFLPRSRHELVLSWGTVSVDGVVVARDHGN